jgi:hypothetical protein
MMTRNLKYPWLPPALLGLLAFLLRFRYADLPRVVWGDEPFYLWLGRNNFSGRGYHLWFYNYWDYHHTPGYPFITAALNQLTDNLARASEWSYMLFGVMLVLAVYFLARRIFGPNSALAAGLLTALAPATAIMPLTWGTMTEPPYLALAMTGVFFAFRAFRRWQAKDVVLAGISFVLAYYIRPEAVVYWGAMGLVLGLRALSQTPRLKNLRYPLLLGFVFALGIFPYLYQVHQVTGVWTISQKVGANFETAEGLAVGDFRRFDQETWGLDASGEHVRFFSHETADASATGFILQNPKAYARIVYGNLRKLLAQLLHVQLFPWYLLIPLALGLFARAWDKDMAWHSLFLLFTLLPGLSFILFFVQERYIASLIPPLFIWTGHGLILLGQWLQATLENLRRNKMGQRQACLWQWLPTLLLMLLFLMITPRQAQSAYLAGSVRPVHMRAADALAAYAQPDDALMSRYVAIAWHANTRWLPTPAASLDEVLAYAHRHHATWWAVDGYEAHYLRPQFASLVDDPQHPPPGLILQAIIPDESGQNPVVIYRLTP